VGRAEDLEIGIALHDQDAACAAEIAEVRSLEGISFNAAIYHREGDEGGWGRLIARCEGKGIMP
jgi:hypothetical protein